MTFNPNILQLYFIMGSQNTTLDPLFVLKEAIKGGITCFQSREKGFSAKIGIDKKNLGRQLRDLCWRHDIPFVVNDDVELAIELEADGIHIVQDDALIDRVRKDIPSHYFIGLVKKNVGKELRDLCWRHDIPFVVNDDVELAIELEADGIHIGQDDAPIEEVRKVIPSHCFIGLSTSTVKESLNAEKRGADYIGVGPIYPTQTKTDALDPIGVSGFKEIKRHISIPAVAISGINEDTARPLYEQGADGIAVVSAISQASDPLLATQVLKKIAKRYQV